MNKCTVCKCLIAMPDRTRVPKGALCINCAAKRLSKTGRVTETEAREALVKELCK